VKEVGCVAAAAACRGVGNKGETIFTNNRYNNSNNNSNNNNITVLRRAISACGNRKSVERRWRIVVTDGTGKRRWSGAAVGLFVPDDSRGRRYESIRLRNRCAAGGK